MNKLHQEFKIVKCDDGCIAKRKWICKDCDAYYHHPSGTVLHRNYGNERVVKDVL